MMLPLLAVAALLATPLPERPLPPGAVDLGVLSGGPEGGPVDFLSGKTFHVGPGGTLTFVAAVRSHRGVQSLDWSGGGVAHSGQTLIREEGDLLWYRYTITLHPQANAPVKAEVSGMFEGRANPYHYGYFTLDPRDQAPRETAVTIPARTVTVFGGWTYTVPAYQVGSSVSRDAGTAGGASRPSTGSGNVGTTR